MIYLAILFSKSLTSENHTLGLDKAVDASIPVTQGAGVGSLDILSSGPVWAAL